MSRRRKFRLRLPSRTLVLGVRTLVMGVVNVTPDSFSDGGRYLETEAAVERAMELERAGMDIIDIGGESTRPGSLPTPPETELARVLPVLERLRGRLKVPISLDTRRASVAEATAGTGIEMLNDISALRSDPALAEVARRHRLPLLLMHMRGTPRMMQKKPFARDVMRDVRTGLEEAVRLATEAGVSRSRLLIDPGIGFGKSYAQNFELLAKLEELAQLKLPIVVGPSRKSFIGHTLGGVAAEERVWGTAAAVTAAVLGGAHIVRVHDAAEMVQVVRIADGVRAAVERRGKRSRREKSGRKG